LQEDLVSQPQFIDPRSAPEPPAQVWREPARNGDELRELVRYCANGQVYDAERWIREGRPIQARCYKEPKKPRVETPLHAAIRTKHRDLVLLLLCNGYRLELEPNGWDSTLNLSLSNRSFDLFELLLKWGAEPRNVDLSTLFDTYRTDLFEYFHNLGIDLTKGHAIAKALAYHTSNRPLFGFAKRHRESNPKIQTELNIALGHHVSEGNEKGVQLNLWAGADPHDPALSLRYSRLSDDEDDEKDEFRLTAIHEACARGHVETLKRLGPDPSRDDFDELYEAASSRGVIDFLAAKALPKNVGPIVRHHLWWATSDSSRWRSTDTLQRLFEIGVRWTECTPTDISDLRRWLLKAPNRVCVDVMKLLATADYSSPKILIELARTPSMRAKMKEVGFIPPSSDERTRYDQLRPTRAREVLKKFGVELPKPSPPPPPRAMWVGSWTGNRKEIKIHRAQLFERVWSEPLARLGPKWGISGNGLKKVCRKLEIPVPPRGYWAKVQASHRVRRPELPNLPNGADPEIIFRVPAREE